MNGHDFRVFALPSAVVACACCTCNLWLGLADFSAHSPPPSPSCSIGNFAPLTAGVDSMQIILASVCFVGHLLWGYPGTYPGSTLTIPGYLPGYYSEGTRVRSRIYSGVTHRVTRVRNRICSGVTNPDILWGYPGTYPSMPWGDAGSYYGIYTLRVPGYLPGYTLGIPAYTLVYSGDTRVPQSVCTLLQSTKVILSCRTYIVVSFRN